MKAGVGGGDTGPDGAATQAAEDVSPRGRDGPPAPGRREPLRVAVLIPARNEERSLPPLLELLGRHGPEAEVLVVDNGSRDRTAEVARAHGARVVREPVAGYGRACQRGLAELAGRGRPPETVVFLDADDRLAARQMERLLRPLREGEAELVTGRRVASGPGVPPHAAAGNAAVALLLRGLYGAAIRDMGPFRAARLSFLLGLDLDDPAYGWNVQMTVRTLRAGGRVREVPVAYRPRQVGKSKISRSFRGSLAASRGLLSALARELLRPA